MGEGFPWAWEGHPCPRQLCLSWLGEGISCPCQLCRVSTKSLLVPRETMATLQNIPRNHDNSSEHLTKSCQRPRTSHKIHHISQGKHHYPTNPSQYLKATMALSQGIIAQSQPRIARSRGGSLKRALVHTYFQLRFRLVCTLVCCSWAHMLFAHYQKTYVQLTVS